MSATITLNAADTYYAHVYPDNYSAIAQSNTSNDTFNYPQAITVSPTATLPDLVIQRIWSFKASR